MSDKTIKVLMKMHCDLGDGPRYEPGTAELRVARLSDAQQPRVVDAKLRRAYELTNRPAIINFSGGRSSAYMTYHLIERYGGYLPRDAVVVFCNTGKEHPATLDFVQECSDRWLLPIRWLEFRYRAEAAGGRRDPKYHFEEVCYETASRDGEPFEALIRAKTMIPNIGKRFCTTELKVNTARWFCQRKLGWRTFTNYLGMRADEPKRISQSLMEECRVEYPLYHAGVTREQIARFWRSQRFDLRIDNEQGNCDLCFMKATPKLLRLIRADPDSADWWVEQERMVLEAKRGMMRDIANAQFHYRRTYGSLREVALTQGDQLPMFDAGDEEDIPCFCGD